MKIEHIATTLWLLLLTTAPLHAQALSTLEEEESSTSLRMEARFGQKAPYTPSDDETFVRRIYRQLDLTKEQNLPLYYPEEGEEGEMNLFRLIISLLTNNDVVAYEYLDGREVFTPGFELNVKDMLDRFHILYEEKNIRGSRHKRYLIEPSDVPCNEVLTYYLREKWVFDTRTSRFAPTIEAICPVLHRVGDFGGEAIKYPMFWIKYGDIAPHLAQEFIVTSNINHARNRSMEDYFTLRMFEGEIYKTGDLTNKSLVQLYPTDSLRTKAQQAIEAQLAGFGDHLWVKEPPKEEIADDTATDADSSKKSVKRSSRSTRSESNDKEEQEEQKEQKEEVKRSTKSSSSNSNSAPVRSVRRRR